MNGFPRQFWLKREVIQLIDLQPATLSQPSSLDSFPLQDFRARSERLRKLYEELDRIGRARSRAESKCGGGLRQVGPVRSAPNRSIVVLSRCFRWSPRRSAFGRSGPSRIKTSQVQRGRCGGGQFTRASEQLFLAQTTLSQHVIALEDGAGVRIFVRRREVIHLTPAGTQSSR
jgi:hypothetical protein